MDNSNHASYAKIGFTLAAGMVAIVFALIYFGGARGGGDVLYAETYSDEIVSGLSVGSEVAFRGVKVGEVKEISFIGSEYEVESAQDRSKVYILMAFNTRTLKTRHGDSPERILQRFVDNGIRATVSSSGITGLSKVQLDFPKAKLQPARISWQPRHICIPPAPSMLASFSDSATRVMNTLEGVDFRQLWSNVTEIAESARSIADGAESIIDSQRGAVSGIMQNLESASSALKQFSEEIRDNPSLILRTSEPQGLPETSR